VTLPALHPLDREAVLTAINQALADGNDTAALSVISTNPLAVFSWIMVEGVQHYYLESQDNLLHCYAAIAILYQRWVEEVFEPADQKERLAQACFVAQVAYLRHQFARLRQLPDSARQAARDGHRRMTSAGLARDQQRWRIAGDEFEAAFAAWREAEDPYFQSQVAADWAAVLEQEGEFEEAHEKLVFAVDVATEIGDLERLGRRRLHQGKLSLMLGNAEQALRDYREAGGVYRVTQEHKQFVVALVAEAEVLRLLGRTADASTSLDVARLTAQQLDDTELLAFVDSSVPAAD